MPCLGPVLIASSIVAQSVVMPSWVLAEREYSNGSCRFGSAAPVWLPRRKGHESLFDRCSQPIEWGLEVHSPDSLTFALSAPWVQVVFAAGYSPLPQPPSTYTSAILLPSRHLLRYQ